MNITNLTDEETANAEFMMQQKGAAGTPEDFLTGLFSGELAAVGSERKRAALDAIVTKLEKLPEEAVAQIKEDIDTRTRAREESEKESGEGIASVKE